MKVAITGSSGLVGSALVESLARNGHIITRLAHDQPWPPLEGHDAIVNLAGENIAGRWTPEKKVRIRESRVVFTRQLAETITRLAQPPKVLVCASAIGFYGNRDDEVLREDSAPGDGFLADVCHDWEAAVRPAAERGIRVVNLRFGVILSASGGALAKMLTPFKLGAGGVIGDGRQWMSWIALDDVTGAIRHALATDSLCGPVNVVAPNPVTNLEFTNTLGGVLGRPTIFPLPAFAARLAFGEMADVLLLSSQRVEPMKLVTSGCKLRFPDLEGALRHLLGR